MADLGRSWGLCWRSWAALGAYVGGLGPKNAKNMPTLNMCLFLERERSWGLCWRSWAALGAYVGGLGPLSEPMLAVLGRSWDLCCRSWAALGAYAGGLGAILEPKWSVLSRSGRSWKGQGRKVAQARRRSGAPNAPNAGLAPKDPNALKPSLHFFKRYVHFDRC